MADIFDATLAGKLTKFVNSGTGASLYLMMSPWNLDGIGPFSGSHFLLEDAALLADTEVTECLLLFEEEW